MYANSNEGVVFQTRGDVGASGGGGANNPREPTQIRVGFVSKLSI